MVMPDYSVHGDYELLEEPNRRIGMDPKLRDVISSFITSIGVLAVYMGWTDSATWAQIGGGILTVVGIVLPFVWKPKTES